VIPEAEEKIRKGASVLQEGQMQLRLGESYTSPEEQKESLK